MIAMRQRSRRGMVEANYSIEFDREKSVSRAAGATIVASSDVFNFLQHIMHLGHNSKAVHCAYAKRALMEMPSLENYEQRAA